MRVATKLGLAEWLEHQAAECERTANGLLAPHPQRQENLRRHTHNYRAAAYALRLLTTEQEIAMLEFQVGGPDGSGIESYDNPIKIIKPLPPLPKLTFWQRVKKALHTEPMYAYSRNDLDDLMHAG